VVVTQKIMKIGKKERIDLIDEQRRDFLVDYRHI
jgi:hypothetical protein